MTHRPNADITALLARAGILMFEYDRDGFLLRASGSCLGGADAALEVRSGLVSPDVVRRATSGLAVVERVAVNGRQIAVRHEPVRGADGRVERVVVTAFDVTDLSGAQHALTPAWLRSLPA